MAARRNVMLSSGVVVVGLSCMVAACGAQVPAGCPPVDHKGANATLLPNPFNCSTFYVCRQGTPLLFECPSDLQFNKEKNVCDYQYNVQCVPLQPVPTPAPTEVATTKFVVTKIVKEVIKPVDVNVEPVAAKDDVAEVDLQQPTARPGVVDADVSVGDVLSKPVVAVDDSQPAVVDADADLSGVNSVVQPVEDTVDDTAGSGLLGDVIDAKVDLGVL